MTLELDIDRYREDYWRSLEWEKPFQVDRPAAFSPAAAMQENYGECSMMWKFISQWIPWQYTDFVDESLSFHETAYIGDWSSLTKCRIRGADALEFLDAHCTLDLRGFEVGQIKHAIQTDAQGQVIGEGVLYCVSAEEFRYSGGGAYWLAHRANAGRWKANAEVDSPEEFAFAIQGPNSLRVLQEATGERFTDLAFNRTRMSSIGQHDVRVLRAGVTGELGYEVHGPSQLGNVIWSAIWQAGEGLGLKRLGGRSQLVSHVEGGFATIGRDYWPARPTTPGTSTPHRIAKSGGSYEWTDVHDLTRSPLELGWERVVSVNGGDFLGRTALVRTLDSGGPRRSLVGLEWDSEDVLEIYASLFRDGPRLSQMDLPRTIDRHSMNPDKVVRDGEVVGCSTSRTYSAFLRRMISLCVIDRSLAETGSDVSVVWGNRGGPQREIRATVRRLPFKEDQRRVDVTTP